MFTFYKSSIILFIFIYLCRDIDFPFKKIVFSISENGEFFFSMVENFFFYFPIVIHCTVLGRQPYVNIVSPIIPYLAKSLILMGASPEMAGK